ncbi:type II secretion system GspH family protein [Shewanella schlegeliana]|uniref:Type II secretion system protein n=1 Tax=Shewanella schlegeliana TaxID=190308 RepID=A0ABS1SWS8_9GAMM|nr:type II secretion system protein [Shewanella schlegeliana]MBL4913006.1 type II secretion system protein [Shewanella schlegeliana]MCL1108898.1 type II secretion system GspH family protein [Shewanella schlegeliana]GIU23780.1 MSHA biogenesis protein MshO [Shewanella schlegeliana]
MQALIRPASRLQLGTLKQRKSLGFTLVEMVTVIIILGVLVLGVSGFLIFGTRIFVDATSVDQVLSQSRFAIERMTREIRNTAPNSIRVRDSGDGAWQCIEMMPIISSASYIDMPIVPASAASSGTAMQSSASARLDKDQFLLIYPLSPADVYTSTTGTQGKLFSIDAVTANATTNDLSIDFGRAVRFDAASPRQRYFGVKGAVSYCFEQVTSELSLLKRYSGYGFNHPNLQPSPADMGTGVLMAENVVNTIGRNSPIAYTPGTLRNNAMVHLNPLFDVQGQTFQYHHQVQVINVP